MRLGENIYKLRTAKKLSQEDFAAAMEVSRQSVSKRENDMAVPELEKLIKLSQLFGVSLDELVDNVPRQAKPEPAISATTLSIMQVLGCVSIGAGIIVFFILWIENVPELGAWFGGLLAVNGLVFLKPGSAVLEFFMWAAFLLLLPLGSLIATPFVLLWDHIFRKNRKVK